MLGPPIKDIPGQCLIFFFLNKQSKSPNDSSVPFIIPTDWPELNVFTLPFYLHTSYD